MYQGKIVFAAWLVPVVYVLLTRWLTRRDGLTAALLLAAGVCSVGMTGSASFIAPLLFATAAIPLLARREWRGLPVVATAGLIPLVVGFVATRKYPIADQLGGVVHPSSWFFHEVFGVGFVAAVGAIALWTAAPRLARSGPPARLATGVAVVALVLLTPALLPTISDAADLSGVLRRTLWIVPMPALVGLFGAFPVALLLDRVTTRPGLRKLAVVLPALLATALFAAFGHPLWTSTSGESLWVSRPGWKANPEILDDAREILRNYRGGGPILADERIMGAIAMITVEPRAVSARRWYALILPGPRRPINQRLWLTDFVEGRRRQSSSEKLLPAISDLRVDLVCPRREKRGVIADLESTRRFAPRFETEELVCYERVRA
jgi:hypothetical protein